MMAFEITDLLCNSSNKIWPSSRRYRADYYLFISNFLSIFDLHVDGYI